MFNLHCYVPHQDRCVHEAPHCSTGLECTQTHTHTHRSFTALIDSFTVMQVK